MPTDEQLMMLMRQRGSLRVAEIRNYFDLRGGWVKPLRDQLTALVTSGRAHYDPLTGSWLPSFVAEP